MKRNRNLDIVRALAVLAVVIYHINVITNINIPIKPVQDILTYGGEFGVTIFFILSGFAIYSSSSRSGKDFKYHNFVTKRLSRILPQYYISLIILLLFTNMAAYLNVGNIGNIFSHIFLFHDWYPSYQGAISGVCWTLGVIFQFYLISPLIFYCIEKKPKLTVISSVIFSVVCKAFVYHFVIAKSVNGDLGVAYYFGLGRTIITALDTFVIGMFLGKYLKVPEDNKKIIFNIIGLVISTIIFVAWLYTANNGLYKDSIIGYIWHSVLAIILAFMMYFFSNIKLPEENWLVKFLFFISKYEYGIYIWHLLLINALCSNSEIIMQLVAFKRKITYVILLMLSIASGVFMSEIIDNINFKEIYLKLKKPIINMFKIIVVITVGLLIYKLINIIYNINNANVFNGNIKDIIFNCLYVLITVCFIKLLVYDRKNKFIVVPAYVILTLIIPIALKTYSMFSNDLEIKIHFENIILLMQHITNQFYSNIFAVLFTGIILAGMYITFTKLDKNDKLCVVVGIADILINIFVIILGYIITINGKEILSESFNKYYAKLLIFQGLIALIMLKPIFLKESIEENK